MSTIRRVVDARTARETIRELTDRKVKLDAVVLDKVAALDALDALHPEEPRADAVDVAYAAGDPDGAHTAALQQLTYEARRQAWHRAQKAASAAVLESVITHRDTIHEQLRTHADKLIARLEAAAAVEDIGLDRLLRDGREQDAKTVADAPWCESELKRLYALRDMRLRRPRETYGTRLVDTGMWRDPRTVRGTTTLLAGLRAGGELWFPTIEDAAAAASPIQAELDAAHQPAPRAGSVAFG